MIAKEINEKLLELVPEIKDLFDSVTSWQEGIETGATIVVEDVFMVYLKDCLKKNNDIGIQRCSSFLEWLSDYIDDEYAGTVLVLSVFEYIYFASDKGLLERVLGPKAMKKYESIDWNLS